jgi:4-hydroxythreonine-4-phosphate dehydrogenase
MSMAKPIILISMGDPAGIGPEICLMAFTRAPQAMRDCVVVGDLACLQRAAGLVGVRLVPLANLQGFVEAGHGFGSGVPVWPTPPIEAALPAWGRLSAVAGAAAAAAIVQGARAVLQGQARALVTAPIHKEALALAGWHFPGHTEMLQHLAAEHAGVPQDEVQTQLPVRMMLASPHLRTVLHSIHIPLRRAIDSLSTPDLIQTIELTHASLLAMLGRKPRLAVAGLNPHAGEGGMFGDEEAQHIAPAVANARDNGIDVVGPVAPDTVFMRAFRHGHWPAQRQPEFDAVVALYHDQGLIPVKLLGIDHGVNVTLGLPLIRTSPDHGTAFDLAGQAAARPESLIYAVETARDLAG